MSDEAPQPPQDSDTPAGAGEGGSQETDAPRRRPKRTGLRRLVPTWRMTLFGLVTFLALVIGAFFVGYKMVTIPAANAAALRQANVYLYSDGTEITREGDVNRENVPLSRVPTAVQRAVLAAEDRDFYSESAINPIAMGRAAWDTVRGEGKQSGSTITQQYVKNYYLSQEQTLTRKAREFFIAIKLDREKTKDEILEGYLNTSYYGRNAYGIQAAAQAYYKKNVDELDVAEGAYLAALLNRPGVYDVTSNPAGRTAAVARWNYVLDGMVSSGWLDETKRASLKFPEPDEAHAPTSLAGQDGYLVEAVKQHLYGSGVVDERTLSAGGFRITTTIDRDKQNALVKSVNEVLMTKLDPAANPADAFVRAGAASVDVATGKVVALYGGKDFLQQYVNNATRTDYQVGSTFKPIVLASALDNHARTHSGAPITPNATYDGTSKRQVQGPNGPIDFRPENEDGKSYGTINVSAAMNYSVNAVFAQMGEDVGPQAVRQTAIDLGLSPNTKELDANPSLAIGTATPSALDMAGVYAALADHGTQTDPWLVSEITRGGQKLKLPDHKSTQAIDREAADTTTQVLRGVVDSAGGTGSAARALGRPAAGKTGTAEEDVAAWFAGYTPQLATVVAVMGQDPEPPYAHKKLYGVTGIARINGGGFPAEIWTEYMKSALSGTEVAQFDLHANMGKATQPGGTQPPEGGPQPTFTPPSGTEPGTSEPPTSDLPTEPTTPPTTGPTDTGEPSGPGSGEPTDGGGGGAGDGINPYAALRRADTAR